MPINITGAGRSYTLPVNSFTNAASGTVISPSDANASHIDITAGINTALAYAQIDGQRRRMGIQANTATPPVSPSDGQVWLVATGGTGAFSGKDKKYAAYVSASWTFFDPLPGDTAIVVATRQSFIYDASGVWQAGNALAGANTDITSLGGLTTPLSVAQGGTAGNTAATARAGIGAAVSGANNDITSLAGLTTPLSLAQGGTTGTSAPTARAGIGAAASGANTDISSLGGLSTPLSVAQGGTGANTVAGATAALNVFTSGLKGLVPASGGGSIAFLRADGIFAVPNAGGSRTISTTDTLIASDIGKLILLAGSSNYTLTTSAAAALGAGWSCQIKATTSIVVTLDPNGAELVDGAISITLARGQQCMLYCTGTSFETIGLNPRVGLGLITVAAGASSTGAIGLPPGFDRVELRARLLPSTTQAILAQVSTNGGASWDAGANNYGLGYDTPSTSTAMVVGAVANRTSMEIAANQLATWSFGVLDICDFSNAGVFTQVNSDWRGTNSAMTANPTRHLSTNTRLNGQVDNAIQLFPSTGTFQGTVAVYGHRG